MTIDDLDEFSRLYLLRGFRNQLVDRLQDNICGYSDRISGDCSSRDVEDVAADLDEVCLRSPSWQSAYERLKRDVNAAGSCSDFLREQLGQLRLVTGYIYLAERREAAELITTARREEFVLQELAS